MFILSVVHLVSKEDGVVDLLASFLGLTPFHHMDWNREEQRRSDDIKLYKKLR